VEFTRTNDRFQRAVDCAAAVDFAAGRFTLREDSIRELIWCYWLAFVHEPLA
jgi:hypothetical protein